MTLEEFKSKIATATDEEQTVMLEWFNDCKGKSVQTTAEKELDKVLTAAKRYYGRMHSKAAATLLPLDEVKNAIKAAKDNDTLNKYKDELNAVIKSIDKKMAGKKKSEINKKEKEIEVAIKELAKLGKNLKLVEA